MSAADTVAYDDTLRLAVYRPEGVLDLPLAQRLLGFLLALEESNPDPFDRLLDLAAVAEIRLSGHQMFLISQERRAATARRRPFRTAILAPTPLAYGMGRMYEILMEGSAVQVAVFREAGGAATWLGVPRTVIEPAATSEP